MADFSLPMSEAFLGTLDNPAISQPYRKAVIRQAPSTFTVEVYPPRKQGTNYHYGMRVIPLEFPNSPTELGPHSPRSSKDEKRKEYDIFRRWDDCLDFQRTLEVEYESISRRRRKGQPAFNHHAKNPLYPVRRAASFDSLPLGPDPSSIAIDVHEYIPKLSKKSPLFKVNQSLISQRGQEFRAMIEALLDEDAHSTIQELRTVPAVRDFFAFWRRDKESEKRRYSAATETAVRPLTEKPMGPALSSAASVAKPSPTINHLTITHTPTPTTIQKLPKSAVRNSVAPSRTSDRPHTANPGGPAFQSSLPSIPYPLNALYDVEPFSDGPLVPSHLTHFGGPLRTTRASTVPNLEYVSTGARTGAISDVEFRPRDLLLLRSVKDNNNSIHRAPMRQSSTPELLGSNYPGRRSSHEVTSKNVDTKVPASGITPLPVFMPPQRHTFQPAGVRRVVLRETAGESAGVHQPLRSFPFDHPDSPPSSTGMADSGTGRAVGGHHLESLAILDPEMYHSLSARQAQSPPWSRPTPTSADSGQVIPRTRKTPPIIDQGNRNARFFVDDPTSGVVDVAGGPPPYSPVISASPICANISHDDLGSLEQVAVSGELQAMKLGNPPARKSTPLRPLLDISDHGYNHASSHLSGMPAPGLLSPNASSRSSQWSPLSSSGVNNQRFRPCASLGSTAEQKRLSLDSLIGSDIELPYLSRNISTPHFPQKNKSADAVYTAPNLSSTSSANATPRGRGSYSSQETDSTGGFGLEDNLGATSSGSLYAPARLPPSKAAIISPKTTPPPRPPRSALRNSSQFSVGIVHRLNESLNANQLPELPSTDAHDFIDSYFVAPPPPQYTLEPPRAPYMVKQPRGSTTSFMSTPSNFTQHHHSTPDRHESIYLTELSSSVASLPSTPFSATFDPTLFGPHMPPYGVSPQNAGMVPVKAVHAQSGTIVLFKVSRYETTFAELCAKIVRKFREAEGLELTRLCLKYLPPRGDHGSSVEHKRSVSVSSTNDLSALASLDNDADWQRALTGNSKIIVRVI